MSCQKVRYPTRVWARGALRRLRGQGHDIGTMRPYRCGECGFFHLGHLPRSIIAGEIGREEMFGAR